MKKTFLFIALCCLSYSISTGADFSKRYGRITDYEMRMESYEQDSSASAVFIYEDVKIYYTFNPGDGKVVQTREYSAKIKILDKSGYSWADINIPYYETNRARETVSQIDAAVYNLVNGKTVKTPLKNSMVFREKINENWKTVKFSIPDVREGSVIEYKYKQSSEYNTNIPTLEIQHSIPVIYSSAYLAVPEWFSFRINSTGHHPINIKEESKAERISFISGQGIDYQVRIIRCDNENIPAIKDEPYVWNYKDFSSKVIFEVHGYQYPRQVFKPLSSDWSSVNETLRKSSFGSSLNMNCPYKDELVRIKSMMDDPVTMAGMVQKFVQSKVKWNGRYSLRSISPRSALRDGTGSSADINFLINSGLRELGIETVPILLNPRQLGRIPYGHATIDNINTFIIMFETEQGRHFLDGTNPFSDVDVLPSQLTVDRARVYGINSESEGWVDLSRGKGNSERHILSASINEKGTIEVEQIIISADKFAMEKNSALSKANNQEEYITQLDNKFDIEILKYANQGRGSKKVTENLKFETRPHGSGNIMLYSTINNFIRGNIFKEQTRILPVEFDHPYTLDVICNIMLPEGHAVQEIPENISLLCCDGGTSFRYITQLNNNVFTVRMTLNVDRILYSPQEYDELRTFFGMVSEKSGSRIVIAEI